MFVESDMFLREIRQFNTQTGISTSIPPYNLTANFTPSCLRISILCKLRVKYSLLPFQDYSQDEIYFDGGETIRKSGECLVSRREDGPSFITLVTVTQRTYCISAAGWPGSQL